MDLYISDLHVGSPLFIHSRLVEQLLASNKYEKIYLLGDILDVWEGKLPALIKRNTSLVKTLRAVSNEKEVNMVVGNHDPSIEELNMIFPQMKIEKSLEVGNTAILHGHIFDELITQFSWLARGMFYIQKKFERLGIDPSAFFRELYHSVAAKRQEKYYSDLVLAIEKEAVETHRKFKYVFMGHTHMPKISRGRTTYVNTGDWTHNYTYVERTGDNIRLLDMNGTETTGD
jgi:UDP-2,3-diacylglucosamine pyrophosphatase LpxH